MEHPSFGAPAIFPQGGKERGAASPYQKGDAPIRYSGDFDTFAEAWGGDQDQRLGLASGMSAIGMNLNTAYMADQSMFTEQRVGGRGEFGTGLFTPKQMAARDIGRG